jgi:hypothetical protein
MKLADVFGLLLALVHQVCQPEPGDVEKIRHFFASREGLTGTIA